MPSIHSFLNFEGPLDSIFNDFSGNNRVVNGAPFKINFAPRSTPLTMIRNSIQEDPQNTLLYKNIVYTLLSAQICAPHSKGSYSILGLQGPGQMLGNSSSSYSTQPYSEVPTIIFTYINPSFTGVITSHINAILSNTTPPKPIGETPLIMLLIVPIYVGDEPSANARYISQFAKSGILDIQGAYPSMKDLLKGQQSFGYPGSLNFILENSVLNVFTNFYTFPMGIVINESTYNDLKPPQFEDFTIENLAVVQSYETDGTARITQNKITDIPINNVSIGSDLLTYIQRYTKDVTPSSFVNPNLKPDQYQCYPFNELQNIDPDSGTVMNLGEAINVNATQNNKVGSMLDWKTIGGLVGGIGGVIVAFILLVGIFWLLSWFSRPIPVTATATATASIPAPLPV